MASYKDIHNKAMDLAFFGDREMNAGNEQKAKELYHEAFEAEREAAFTAQDNGTPEPGLSILFRSAASLALQCKEYREAERIIAHALAGNPTNEIAAELRELLLDVYETNNITDDTNVVSYELQIPKSETTIFKTLSKRMGWIVSNFPNVKGKIATL